METAKPDGTVMVHLAVGRFLLGSFPSATNFRERMREDLARPAVFAGVRAGRWGHPVK